MINRYILFVPVLFVSFVPAQEPIHAAVHTVTFTCCQYTPSSFSASVGDTVVWEGNFALHPLQSTTIPSGAAPFSNSSGTSFLYVIPVAGNYNYQCAFHQPLMAGSFSATTVGLQDNLTLVPTTFQLHQNYPNPFNPSTRIPFSVQVAGFTSLKVYDVLGREVATLVNENLQPGSYEVTFQADGLTSGVYLYRFQSGNFTAARTLLLLK